ncbi:MAG: tetratricopeptide repeat protein [Candidatus Riflebacteria bacterium]|nr:tetratricopeptide repeat protein [Candidatus Riflebacteria bacterium]
MTARDPRSARDRPPPERPAPEGSLGQLWLFPGVQHGALVALGLALLVYFNSLPGQFVFDDDALILENPLVTDRSQLPRILFDQRGPAYRPVRTLSYALDYRVWETNPAGYHLSNVLYHGLVGLVIFLIARALFLGGPVALVATALFVTHPIHTDAVSYISGRRDVLSSLFYLAGFYLFLSDRRSPSPLKILGLVTCYVLGVFTKEMAATLPVVCLAYHLTWGRHEFEARPRGPTFYASFLAFGTLFAYYAVYLDRGVTLMPRYHGGSFWITMLTMARAVCHYLGLLVAPLYLSADYSWNAFPLSRGLLEPATLIAVVGAVGTGLAPFFWAARRPALSFGLFWFWLTLGPVLQIVPHTEMVAEHYLYLPSAAFCIGLAVLSVNAMGRWPRGAAVAIVALLALYGARTVVRNADWVDGQTLWARTVETYPTCARARTNLGLALEKQGLYDEAVREYEMALLIMPDDPYTLNNLGTLHFQLGRNQEARRLLARAVARVPGYPEALSNLGAVECELGDLPSALAHIRAALTAKPHHVSALLNLGMVLRRHGKQRHAEAEAAYQEAIRIDPGNATAFNNLGALYLDAGQGDRAVKAFSRVISLRTESSQAWMNLARAWASSGHRERASESLVRAAMLQPTSGPVQLESARLALKSGLPDVARRLYRRASDLGSRDFELERSLGVR